VTPEDKAREEIDRPLATCSGIVEDHEAMNIMAGPGVAARADRLKPFDVHTLLQRQA
jgi:hypothetical protein